MKLNLGCGDDIRKGYCNIDCRNITGSDLICDVRNLKTIFSNSVDEIMAKDVLEHFPRNDTELTLKEWYRTLRSGGKLRLCFPNLRRIAERYLGIGCDDNLQHKIDADFTSYLLYGGQDYNENFHCAIWDSRSISKVLRKVGFIDITTESDGGTNLIVKAFKGE